MLISVNNLNKSFGERQVLHDVTFSVEDNGRYGLIGVNGAGKSTLLNIITGNDPDCDNYYRQRDITVGYLKQNTGLDKDSTIIEEMRKAFADVFDTDRDLREIELEMSRLSDHDSREYKALMTEYARKQAYFDSRDGYNTEVKIKTVLNGMGFGEKSPDTFINTLSGGEKTRLATAKLLLEEPKLLILDEPTNHLDFKTLAWLEEYLVGYKGAILVVSHDRYFLDKITDTIFELEQGRLEIYKGNYSAYLIQKEERKALLKKKYDAQQAEVAKLKTYIDKNISRASTAASARSRQKALDNMELAEQPRFAKKEIKLRFDVLKESYKDVLKTENLTLCVGKEKRILCSDINIDIKKSERIAVVGDNGIGKSTLLKTILGMHSCASGSYTWGKNTDVGYYEQENQQLNPDKTAIDELRDRFPQLTETQIRKSLGNVCLSQEDAFKPISILSGGERARLALCILMLEKTNVMLLDEPTNHLDLASKEVLEAALEKYSGTLIFVSHDRYLLNKIPDKIIEITKDGAVVYNGKYDYYLEKKQTTDTTTADLTVKPLKTEKTAGYGKSKEQRRTRALRAQKIRETEARISELETENEVLREELLTEEVYTDYKLSAEKTVKLDNNVSELEKLYTSWEELQEEMDTDERQ